MTQSSELNYLMRSIQIKEQRLYTKKTVDYQLSSSQARALIYIEAHPGANQKDVADYFSLRGASTSTLIKKLEERGYVEKTPSRGSQDRSNRLSLTASGAEIAASLQTAFADVENQLVNKLTPEEANTLIRLLSKIDKNLVE